MGTAVELAPVLPDLPGLDDGRRERFYDVCERLSNGEILEEICEEQNVKASTVWRWSETSSAARKTYAHARVYQIHALVDQAVLISMGRGKDARKRLEAMVESIATVEEKDKDRLLDALATAAIQRDRLTVDTIKWLASKIAPKLYGDKLDITTNGESLRPGVVFLPAPDAPLVPPDGGMLIEQTTRIAVSNVNHEVAGNIKALMYQYKQGKMPGSPGYNPPIEEGEAP